MLPYYLQQLLGFLAFANLALAGRFRFSIQEIHVENTVDIKEDDLVLAVASNAGLGPTNHGWLLGSAESNTTIKWGNLTHEFEVSPSASNVSVALSLTNNPNAGEEILPQIIGAVTSVAENLPPIVSIPAAIIGSITDLFNCTGAAAADIIGYDSKTLNDMAQNQQACNTKNYTYAPPKAFCGIDDSLYTVTYCLERLDAKPSGSGTVNLMPGTFMMFVGFAVGMIFV